MTGLILKDQTGRLHCLHLAKLRNHSKSLCIPKDSRTILPFSRFVIRSLSLSLSSLCLKLNGCFPAKMGFLSSPMFAYLRFLQTFYLHKYLLFAAEELDRETKMKGTSKVIMGATLIMVVTLAVVLGLILVLLTELYCSLLLRRRRHLRASAAAATTIRTNASPSSPTSHPQQHPPPSPLFTSIYAQGVIQAPRNFLFPLVSSKEELTEAKKQLVELHHQAIQIQSRDFITSPRHLGLVSASSPSQPVQEVNVSVQGGDDDTSKATVCGEHLVYISNPIYENDEEGKESSGSDTPFQTPHTSPSRLETIGSSGEDEEAQAPPSCNTPPLSPMKTLPAEASSVSLKDATSLGNSGNESHSNNGLSSSSSATPCTSLSW